MEEKHTLTPEDRAVLNVLRSWTDRRLLLLIALIVLKDSRIREAILLEVSSAP